MESSELSHVQLFVCLFILRESCDGVQLHVWAGPPFIRRMSNILRHILQTHVLEFTSNAVADPGVCLFC